jgi:outer membrane protein assembly factor BamB
MSNSKTMVKYRNVALLFTFVLFLACATNTRYEPVFFQADARHTGFYETSGIDSLRGVAWRFKTDGRVFSSPVRYKNSLFVGSDDGNLYALDAADGSLLWKFGTGGRVSSSAAVYDEKVYVVSFDGFIYCVDQKFGKEIWKFKTAGERVFSAPGIHGIPEKNRDYDDPWDMFLSSPVVANGKVYFGSGAGVFYALDCNTGSLAWEFKTNGVIHSSPAYANRTVYFGSWDSYLYALNSEDGSLRWKFKTGVDTIYYNQVGFQSSPVIYDGLVYSGCRDAHIWAIEAETGDLKWKYYNNGSWVIATPAIHNDTLYFTTSDTHKLIALNSINGKQLYTGDCRTFGFSSPAVAGGKIYLGTFGGSLMAFDAKNGSVQWEFQTPAAKANRDSILAPNGEFNYAKVFKENSYEGSLKAVEVLYSTGSILSSPSVFNGMVYFGSTDSCIYALY